MNFSRRPGRHSWQLEEGPIYSPPVGSQRQDSRGGGLLFAIRGRALQLFGNAKSRSGAMLGAVPAARRTPWRPNQPCVAVKTLSIGEELKGLRWRLSQTTVRVTSHWQMWSRTLSAAKVGSSEILDSRTLEICLVSVRGCGAVSTNPSLRQPSLACGELRLGTRATDTRRLSRRTQSSPRSRPPQQELRPGTPRDCYFTATREICSSPGYTSSFTGFRSIGGSVATVVRVGNISGKYCA